MTNQATPSTTATPAVGSPVTPVQKHYFDIHATGVGYLNRVRTVPVKGKGNDYLAVDIAALRGEPGKIEYTYFGCRVSGKEAQRVIREDLAEAIKANKKILVRFKVGDLVPETFTYQKGVKQGQTGITIRSHLLFVLWAKVDGQYVYRAPTPVAATAQPTEDQAPTTGEASAQVAPKAKVFPAARDMSTSGMDDAELDALLLEMEGAEG